MGRTLLSNGGQTRRRDWGCLGRAEHRPRRYRQTQIDSRGIERVDGFLQIDAEGLLRIQRPGDADQALGKIGIERATAERIPR